MKKKYSLGFVNDNDIFDHVKNTVLKYRLAIDLKTFNKNIIDPIKLTFDSKVYGKSFKEIIESECLRQIDKTNSNHIGYFHQRIFKYFGNGWEVPTKGFDVVNEKKHIYVEMKNKHNTMNSSSSQKTYMKMQDKILRDDSATCMLVEIIAKKTQNVPWVTSLDGERFTNKRIRRVSIDKFYEIVTGDPFSFMNLCQALPYILDDVLLDLRTVSISNSVFSELEEVSGDYLKSLYLLAFKHYEGFTEQFRGDK